MKVLLYNLISFSVTALVFFTWKSSPSPSPVDTPNRSPLRLAGGLPASVEYGSDAPSFSALYTSDDWIKLLHFAKSGVRRERMAQLYSTMQTYATNAKEGPRFAQKWIAVADLALVATHGEVSLPPALTRSGSGAFGTAFCIGFAYPERAQSAKGSSEFKNRFLLGKFAREALADPFSQLAAVERAPAVVASEAAALTYSFCFISDFQTASECLRKLTHKRQLEITTSIASLIAALDPVSGLGLAEEVESYPLFGECFQKVAPSNPKTAFSAFSRVCNSKWFMNEASSGLFESVARSSPALVTGFANLIAEMQPLEQERAYALFLPAIWPGFPAQGAALLSKMPEGPVKDTAVAQIYGALSAAAKPADALNFARSNMPESLMTQQPGYFDSVVHHWINYDPSGAAAYLRESPPTAAGNEALERILGRYYPDGSY